MISAVIITFNEEKNIARCIRSLSGVADEVVVVDSFSNDATPAICRDMNVRFVQHSFEGYIEQKNFALQQASYDYVLALDADECLSDELRQNLTVIKNNLQHDGYWINRRNNFCGKWIRHSGWYPDRKLRLWKKEKGAWSGMNPHDKVVLKDSINTAYIKGDLLHYTATSIQEFKKQQERFAMVAAGEIFKLGKKRSALISFLGAVFMFKRRYLFQLGFLDGYYGFVICREAARYTWLKYTLANEMFGNK